MIYHVFTRRKRQTQIGLSYIKDSSGKDAICISQYENYGKLLNIWETTEKYILKKFEWLPG